MSSFQTNIHDGIVHHPPVKYKWEPNVAMQRIVLFIGGASHATLLSFAPLVIVDILRSKDETEISMPNSSGTWNVVSRYIAILVAAYFAGKAIGIFIGYSTGFGRRTISDPKYFSRITGVILALHLLCLDSGSWEFPLRLCFIRFIMGVLVGLVSHNVTAFRITTNACEKEYLEEQDPVLGSPIMNTNYERTKCLISGFAVSSLSGGLLYNLLRHSTLLTFLTGGYAWSCLVASIFVVGVARASEFVLQLYCLKRPGHEEGMKSSTHGQPLLEEGTIAPPPSALKRRTGGKNLEGTPTRSWNRVRLGSYNRGRLVSPSHGSNRGRLLSQSSESSDRFFDCESQANDSFEEQDLLVGYGHDPMTDLGEEDHGDSIAKFIDGRCIFEDGTPASVPAGLCPSVPPRNYQEMHKSKAMAKWSETQRWRMKSRAWKILDTPHPWFPKIKDHVSSTLHGFSRMGYPVVYEKPRDMHIKALFQNELEVSDLIHNYVFFLEYMSHIICNKPEVREALDQRPDEQSSSKWGFIIVWDMTNFSLTANASASVLKYLSQADTVNSLHYPDTMVRGFAINTPFWFSGAFRTVKSVLPASLKIDIFSGSNQLDGLRAHIDDNQIPKEFGGSSAYKLGEHPFETDLHELAQTLNSRGDSENDHEIEIECDDVPNYMSQELCRDDHISQAVRKGSIDTPQVCNPNDDIENTLGSLSPLCKPPPSELIHIRTDRSVQTVPLRYNEEAGGKKAKMKLHHSEEYVFVLVSIMHSLLCSILGSLQTILPLWLMCPHTLGGLGYGPSRAGMSYFSSSVVLMLLLQTKLSRLVFHVPENASLRGYRIGVGAQVFFLILLPFIPAPSSHDNFLTMIAIILLGTSLVIAIMIGINSVATLHLTATISYVEKLSLQCDTRTSLGNLINRIVNACKRGGLTYAIGVGGEIIGAIIVMPMYAYSTDEEIPLPLGASLKFYTAASLCVILYTASFSLSLKLVGKQNKQDGVIENQGFSYLCALLGDIYTIATGDVALLVDSIRGRRSMYAEEVFDSDAKTT